MGDIRTFVDTLESRLATIPGLRIYDRPVSAINEFPCAIIQDHDPLAQYTVSSNEAVYFLTVTVLHSSNDIREAWEGLEPYLSASGIQSIRAAVDLIEGVDMSYVHVISSSSRRRIQYAGAYYWGAELLVEGRARLG